MVLLYVFVWKLETVNSEVRAWLSAANKAALTSHRAFYCLIMKWRRHAAISYEFRPEWFIVYYCHHLWLLATIFYQQMSVEYAYKHKACCGHKINYPLLLTDYHCSVAGGWCLCPVVIGWGTGVKPEQVISPSQGNTDRQDTHPCTHAQT